MIFFHSKTNTFYLQGKNVSYVFRKDEYGLLNHLYFGKKVACGEDLSFVYRPCDALPLWCGQETARAKRIFGT